MSFGSASNASKIPALVLPEAVCCCDSPFINAFILDAALTTAGAEPHDLLLNLDLMEVVR